MEKWITDADAHGLRLSIHALGDRGIDMVMAQLRKIAGEDISERRFRIEHFQYPTKAAIKLLAQYGLIASMQPYHAIDDGRWAEGRLGLERLKTSYAFRTILDTGGRLSFGSDWPVAPLPPIQGIYAAVTRQTTDGANPDAGSRSRKSALKRLYGLVP